MSRQRSLLKGSEIGLNFRYDSAVSGKQYFSLYLIIVVNYTTVLNWHGQNLEKLAILYLELF